MRDRAAWFVFGVAMAGMASGQVPASRRTAETTLSQRERAEQMLNRFSFGPRPGDVDRVAAMGAERWFEAQLNPGSIGDGALEKRLQDYPALAMTPSEALETFPDRRAVEQVADGKKAYPADPLLKSVYEVEVYKLLEERGKKNQPAVERTEAEKDARKKVDQSTAARIAGELFGLAKGERMAALNAMPPADRIAFANNVQGDQKNALFADWTPRERETVLAFQGGVAASYRIVDELAQARVMRDILSERQLQETMTDFWFNHFNVFAPKDSDQWYTASYERDAIRPHALGKFRTLLLATAESPAMMVYLDNWLSIGPDSAANGVNPANPQAKQGKRGLNENYGREVMELHTVGVNGGYSQADVTHLAAILTGWSVDKPHQAGTFVYDPKKHEPGTKQWFGYTIDEQGNVWKGPAAELTPALRQAIAAENAPDGMKQGIAALCLLAASPKTAHFVGYLIAQRFLADEPPAGVVNRMAAAYLASDGDIKTVLRTLVESPEFNSRRYFRNKVKTPEEFVASAFRGTGTDPRNPAALVGLLGNQLGMPPYKKLEPTGYYATADHWMNTQSLLARLNFADQLTHDKFANQKFDAARLLATSLMEDRAGDPAMASKGGADVALAILEGTLLGGEMTEKTDQFIHSQMSSQMVGQPGGVVDTLNLLTALLLGSPEFQMR